MTSVPGSGAAPPPELVAWMKRYGGVGPDAGVPELVEGAQRALTAALERPGRDREAAFALLAADGLVTSALERLADADDPERGLRGVLDSVVESLRTEEPTPGDGAADGESA